MNLIYKLKFSVTSSVVEKRSNHILRVLDYARTDNNYARTDAISRDVTSSVVEKRSIQNTH